MANSYEGTFRIRHHADKGITLDRGIAGSTLTAADVNLAMDKMLEAASSLKCGFDRWTLYIPGVNEKLGKDDKQVSAAKVKAALKEAGNVVELHRGKYGIPKMVIGKETIVTKRVSKFQDIA
jgi:hypothetical protein